MKSEYFLEMQNKLQTLKDDEKAAYINSIVPTIRNQIHQV